MATGPETLNAILDAAAAWVVANGKDPRKVCIPIRMAWDLAKCRREDLGELSGKVMKKGVMAFEEEGLLGLDVKLVRERDAVLTFE